MHARLEWAGSASRFGPQLAAAPYKLSLKPFLALLHSTSFRRPTQHLSRGFYVRDLKMREYLQSLVCSSLIVADAVRRQAHRATGSKTYTATGRTRSNEQPYSSDHEVDPRRTHSWTEPMPAIQEQRGPESGSESKEATKEFGPPSHHATEPFEVEHSAFEKQDDPSSKPDPEVSIIEAVDGTTKRGRFKKMYRKHDHDDDGDETLANQASEDLAFEERRRKAFKRKIPVGQQFRYVIGNWVMILMLLVPVGFTLRYTHANPIAVFCVNFVAIIPSATMLSSAVDELGVRAGDYVGALLNMTFGYVACHDCKESHGVFNIPQERGTAHPFHTFAQISPNQRAEALSAWHNSVKPAAHDRSELSAWWRGPYHTVLQCIVGPNYKHVPATSGNKLGHSICCAHDDGHIHAGHISAVSRHISRHPGFVCAVAAVHSLNAQEAIRCTLNESYKEGIRQSRRSG
jgi:hypothetical protein